jgi:hypothetical protein
MEKTKGEPIKTVLTISIGFLVMYLFTRSTVCVYISLMVGSAGLLSKRLAAIIDFLWTKLAFVLGLIIPNILLSLIFYFFLFPLSLLSKLFAKKDPLILSNKIKSTFVEVRKNFSKQDFEKPW